MGSEAAANVLGTIGTVFWCIQLIPQIIHNYRRKSCEGLPASMMFLWALSGVPFGIYFIVKDSNIPIQVQPQIFMVLALTTFGQCLYYPPVQWPLWKTLTFIGVTLAVFGGVEAGCIVPFEKLYRRGIHWPVTLVGIIAAVLLGVGLLPPYWELYKRKGQVVGINFIFLTIDSLGAFFSIMSLVAQDGDFDILGCILYVVILVLEGGIFMSHLIWLVRSRKERREKKLLEQTADRSANSGPRKSSRQEEVTSESSDPEISVENNGEGHSALEILAN
jgi:uncharacterized protein with PQ loop repeat